MAGRFIGKKPYKGPVTAIILDWAGTAVDYGSIGPVSVFSSVFSRHILGITIDGAISCMWLMKKDHIRTLCRLDSLAEKWRRVHGRDADEYLPHGFHGEDRRYRH